MSIRWITVVFALALLQGCATSAQPGNIDNICDIFDEKRGWYSDARASERRWGTPIPVMMAMMYQESSFQYAARPPRTRLLGFIPWRRASSAHGYAQAKNEVWSEYRRDSGNPWASRRNFRDAIDFVGWYNRTSHQRNNIALDDARNLYLAYHEGHGGFSRGTYNSKAWLIGVAGRVDERADRFEEQLSRCRRRFRRR